MKNLTLPSRCHAIKRAAIFFLALMPLPTFAAEVHLSCEIKDASSGETTVEVWRFDEAKGTVNGHKEGRKCFSGICVQFAIEEGKIYKYIEGSGSIRTKSIDRFTGIYQEVSLPRDPKLDEKIVARGNCSTVKKSF